MKYAYITVLTNEDYILGVKVLKKSLDMTNSGGEETSICHGSSK